MFVSLALVYTISTCLASINQVHSAAEDKFSCPHGWTRYGSKKCLKYVNELQDYERAQASCRSKNQGSLVTIHSHDEQNFVYSYIHSIAASSTPIWLGAKQMDFESILWLDKTENSYVNWAPSEPSHPDEICIAINPRNGQWHDVMCTEANVPACERAPTTQWPFFVAFCSEGWFQFNDEKCVRIISSQALNFYESQELCRSKYNSKLLSIKSEKESEFVHNLIKFRDLKLPVWLGAVQNDFSSFNWIDKSDVTFTNWAEGEPNDPDHACISMTALGGKWSDNDCKEQKLILCQKVPEDGSCETGWLQFRQDQCYRFVHFRLTYDDGESLCNNLYGGHLPSIHSQEEQFMVTQFLASVNVKNGSDIWLGGRQMDFHNFNWADGSMFNYSYWEHGQPDFPAEKCIEMSWRNGRWNDINCRLKRAVLCERQVNTRNLVKPNLYLTNCLANLANCNNSSLSTGPTTGLANNGTAASAAADPLVAVGAPTSIVGQAEQQSQLETTSTFQIDQQTNRSSGGDAAATTTTTNDQSSLMMLPPDDRPIKVITSIMHREHQSAGGALSQAQVVADQSGQANSSSSQHPLRSNDQQPVEQNGTATTSTFIHYNLPPPDPATFTQPQATSSLIDAGSKTPSREATLGKPTVASNNVDAGQSELMGKKEQVQQAANEPTTVTTPTMASSSPIKELISQPNVTESIQLPSSSEPHDSSSSSSSLLDKIVANRTPTVDNTSAQSKLSNQDFDQFVGVNKDEHLIEQQLKQSSGKITEGSASNNNDNNNNYNKLQSQEQVQAKAANNQQLSSSPSVAVEQRSA